MPKDLRSNLSGNTSQLLEELTDDPLPQNTIFLEFGDSKHPSTVGRYKLQNDFTSFLTVLGTIYLEGVQMDLANLYPKVEYPVSKGTPSISPLIKWNHDHDWFVAFSQPKPNWSCSYRFSAEEKQWNFLLGRVVDGKQLVLLSLFGSTLVNFRERSVSSEWLLVFRLEDLVVCLEQVVG